MFEALIQIPGPVFLQYFIGFALISLIIGWLLINLDGSTQYSLPSPTRFGPIAIGVLRNGRVGAIQTALFNLWRLHLIEITGSGEYAIVKNVATTQLPDNEVEKLLYQFAAKPRKPEEFFTDANLQTQIDTQLKPIYRGLEKLHLVRSKLQMKRAKIVLWAVLGAITIVGGTKLGLGFYHSKPVVFLILSLGIALIGGFFLLQTSHLSRLGQNYLKLLVNQYNSLKKSLAKGGDQSAANPAFGVAVFGMSILAGIAALSLFESTFASASPDDTSFGSGGADGGGCGGGSGGGCGGCGGG